ncbi:uncharacterized protein LOC108451709 [Gossypium arboreum]|uniref:uncharacterized protein LOC108451709 n=1 Tax=Gossypium arboreum TaxID=29729 RepID=UPI000818F469|nr:uncharacterized protein LOC108451709 [Gossypium arboreum]
MGRGQRTPGRGAGSTEARKPALVYASRRHDDGNAPDVITDIGSTHSYVACSVSGTLGIPYESASSEILVVSLLVQSIRVSKLFKDVPLEVQGIIFLADLMELPFGEFNLILVEEKLVRKGREAYLAYISVADSENSSVKDIRTVRNFPDVFLEVLSGFPPSRKVEFGIKLIPGTAPVSIAPYRMAPNELTELKAQIQELLDRGFIRPSVSPFE